MNAGAQKLDAALCNVLKGVTDAAKREREGENVCKVVKAHDAKGVWCQLRAFPDDVHELPGFHVAEAEDAVVSIALKGQQKRGHFLTPRIVLPLGEKVPCGDMDAAGLGGKSGFIAGSKESLLAQL